MVFVSNIVTKGELLHKFNAEDVIKNKMITVAGQMFFEYEQKIDKSNQIIKGCEAYIGGIKSKIDISEKVCRDFVKEDICFEKELIYKKSINRFIKILNI